jgi:prepilin-type N-terminal cleavage/methylation domain-containing protein
MSRARDESGFTLVELLVACVVGVIVLLAALSFLDRAFLVTREAHDRTDSQQRGRLAMDLVVQQLRSQVCLGNATSALLSGGDSSVTFTTDLGSGIEKRTLTFDSTTRKLTEDAYVGTGTYPNYTYPSSPSRSRTLLTDVVQTGSTPVFSYYAFDPNNPAGGVLSVTTPVSAANLSKVARIGLAFTARPAGATNDRRAITLQDEVYMRTADPSTTPTRGVSCL